MASDGNKEAAKALYGLALTAVSGFEGICEDMPEIFEPIARKTSCWPGFLSCDADIVKWNAAHLATLQLGREAGLNYMGKQWTRETLETGIAVGLYTRVQAKREIWLHRGETRRALKEAKRLFPAYKRTPPVQPSGKYAEFVSKFANEFALLNDTYELAKKLQPLSRNNYAQWFEAAWPAFIADYGKAFEDHKCFAHYWRNPTFTEGDPKNPGATKSRSNARALIRGAIKRKIRQSFQSIAVKVG